MAAAVTRTLELRVIPDLPASPSPLAFLAAGQVTGLSITPIQPQSIVICPQPQR